MITEIMDYYTPEQFLFREDQVKKVESVFQFFNRDGFADNLFITGVTGSGKTSIVRKVISEHNNCLYISCKEKNTTKRIFQQIAKSQHFTVSDVVDKMIVMLQTNKKVLVIDEVAKLNDITEFGNALNRIWRETSVPIIIITNDSTFLDKLPEDCRYTLLFQRVVFPAYDAQQLKGILDQRLRLIKDSIPTFPDYTKEHIAALSVKRFLGSARIVLALARKCIQNRCFSQDFTTQIANQIEQEEMFCFIDRLGSAEKRFLADILELSKTKPEFTASDIHKYMPDHTISRVSQLITTFVQDYSILNERIFNQGRSGGMYRILKFSSEMQKYQLYKCLHPEEFMEENMDMALQDEEIERAIKTI